MMTIELSPDASRRYARHLVLPEIGAAGQVRLLDASVLVVGVGGLGSAAAGYLAAMGIGMIALVDADRVELSNLQRQILFETADIGQPKVQAAANRLQEINPDIHIIPHMERFSEVNAEALLAPYSLAVDATDNFQTRIALHDACSRMGKTLISAAISGFSATITTYKPTFPCLHCLMPELPEREISCAQEGIIGALAGVMGSMQALEVVKELLSLGNTLAGRQLRYDALSAIWQEAKITHDPACQFCAE